MQPEEGRNRVIIEGVTPEIDAGRFPIKHIVGEATVVEADILVVSVFPDDPSAFFDEQFVLNAENLLEQIAPEMKDCAGVVRVINVPSVRDGDHLHVYLDATNRRGLGLFGPRQGETSKNGDDFGAPAPQFEIER